jgi:Dullard-like phosphatase family protein
MRKYDTYVFTAGMELYASPLLDLLDPDRRLSGRLYRQHCKYYRGYSLKDLSAVLSDLSRTVLVDNNPISFGVQPSNGIPVPNFYSDSSDSHLVEVMKTLDVLADSDSDVRPQLNDMFRLPDRLRSWRVQLGLESTDARPRL